MLPDHRARRPQLRVRRLASVWMSAAVLVAGLLGCQSDEQITSYTVAKPPPPVRPKSLPLRAVGRARPEGEASAPTRILGAIVPRGRQVWFFKLTGPTDAVVAQAEVFVRFLKTIDFSGGTPRWNLPAGWTEKPGDQFRYKTLVIDTPDAPLEMSVSMLPGSGGDFDQYLLANVNRWRDQVQLAPLAPEELADRTLKLELADGEAWLVNIEGRGQGGAAKASMPLRTENTRDGQ
jgi:hypothetical protein